MKKYLPFSRRQPSLDRFAISRGGWAGSDRFGGKSLRRTSAASLNTRSIQVVRGAYNIDLNKVDSSFTKLHRACLLNDDTQVRKQLHKVDNNLFDSSRRYPIHLATVNGNFAIIKLLIENGANPNVQDNEGNTPLIKSIECGHEHLVKYFLSNGADPNISDLENNSALHWAIITESIIAIDALISSKKCNLALRNNKDETSLHLAVRSPLINTITFESMVKGGSDLSIKDQLGLTPLDIAQACNNKLALNAFTRCGLIDYNRESMPSSNQLNSSQSSDNKTNGTNSRPLDDQETLKTVNLTRLCDDYKQKYMTKNRENLEFEKKMIQMSAQIERLRLDMSFMKEQNEKLRNDYEIVHSENSKLKQDNANLSEQLKSLKQKKFRIEPRSIPFESSPRSESCSKINFEKLEAIECRGHEEFLLARALNQERINKLKSGLTTMQL